MALREYQTAVIGRIRSAMRQGHRRVVLVSPTGSGKTITLVDIAARTVQTGRKVLWLAHRSELIDQAIETLQSAGLTVGALCASSAAAPNPYAPVQVASVQTLLARNLRPAADMVFADECVPGDTMLGGRRADSLRVGDRIESWDGRRVVSRPIARVFVRRPITLRTIVVGSHSLAVTNAHPIWVEGHGYVEAASVRVGDLCRVWSADQAILWADPQDLLGDVREQEALHDDGAYQPCARRAADARSQPDVLRRIQAESDPYSARYGTSAAAPWWQRDRSHGSRIDAGVEIVATDERGGAHAHGCGLWLSEPLQGRCGRPLVEVGDRDRRLEPWHARETRTGRKEDGTARVARVDRVEVHERGSDGTFGGRCPDGLVYNFEVEGEHNYFANGILTHNCHHYASAAEQFAALLKDYADAWVVGATATPERGDGCGLRDPWDSLVVGATVPELTAQGFLVPCEVLRPDKPLEPGKIAQSPVDAYMAHAAGRLAIVFARGVSLANEYADQFNARGVTARAVSAETPWAERRLYIDAFRRGAIRVLTSVGVLTEGFDAPETSACILARGCGSAGLYLQMVGRVLRPAPGKKDAVLLDLRGVSHEHGRPEDEREYSLDGRGIRLRDPQSYCPVCGAAKAPGEPCASCGYEPSGDETAKPDTITGAPLKPWMRLRETDDDGMRVKRLARWIADAKRRSFKDGWFKAKFNAVYGRWPSALELEKAREIAWATGRAEEVRT